MYDITQISTLVSELVFSDLHSCVISKLESCFFILLYFVSEVGPHECSVKLNSTGCQGNCIVFLWQQLGEDNQEDKGSVYTQVSTQEKAVFEIK